MKADDSCDADDKHKLGVQTFVSIPPHPLLPLVPFFVYF